MRGLAAGLGSSATVSSPTFTIEQIYKTSQLEIHHFDFYRLGEPGVVADEMAEALADPKAIVAVEWGKTVAEVLPAERLIIKFEPRADDPDERQITITYPADKTKIIEAVENEWAN